MLKRLLAARAARLVAFALGTGAGLIAAASCDRYEPPPPNGCDPTDFCCNEPTQCRDSAVVAAIRPPPLSGGTLLVSRDGASAVVSDPDRERIVLVSLTKGAPREVIATPPGGVPGRAVEDAEGNFHVVLREAGVILTIDASGDVASTAVCPAPRGIAFAASTNELLVACAGGEVVRLDAGATPVVRSQILLDADLRDIVVPTAPHGGLEEGIAFVSHFRSARVDVVDAEGHVSTSKIPQQPNGRNPAVAWRMIPDTEGGAIVIHQEANNATSILATSEHPYNQPTALVVAGVTSVSASNDQPPLSVELDLMSLPVDVAMNSAGSRFAMLSAGNARVVESTIENVLALSNGSAGPLHDFPTSAEPVALTYRGDSLVVQIREPSMLELHDPTSGILTQTIDLGGASADDSGYRLFHGDPDARAAELTCASCHPEGGDDGLVWSFAEGPRRTQSLAGDVLRRAPFHWQGNLPDMRALVEEVFVQRMGHDHQGPHRIAALETYVATFPALPGVARPIDADAAARGRAVFRSAESQCAECHDGPELTNNLGADVGTGGTFQVPSLIGLGIRPPYMHDGCAKTIGDRFGAACGGSHHGGVATLSGPELADLTAYLETL